LSTFAGDFFGLGQNPGSIDRKVACPYISIDVTFTARADFFIFFVIWRQYMYSGPVRGPLAQRNHEPLSRIAPFDPGPGGSGHPKWPTRPKSVPDCPAGFWPTTMVTRAFSAYCLAFCIPLSNRYLQIRYITSAQFLSSLFWPKNRATPGKTPADTAAYNYRPINAL